jgi:hypothetical protein
MQVLLLLLTAKINIPPEGECEKPRFGSETLQAYHWANQRGWWGGLAAFAVVWTWMWYISAIQLHVQGDPGQHKWTEERTRKKEMWP